MAMRKEQALFLVTLAFGFWMYSGIESVGRAKLPKATDKPYTTPVGLAPIEVPGARPESGRDLFLEPSESRPLPPRTDLPFPELRALPVVLLPLEVGQQPAAYHWLRHAALPPAPAAENGGGQKVGESGGGQNGGSQNGQPPAAPQPGGSAAAVAGANVQDDPTLRYDTLHMDGQRYYGFFIGEDSVKFDLASRPGPYDGTTIVIQWVDQNTGRTLRPRLEVDGAKVNKLVLAKTLRNKVGMQLHGFQPGRNTEKQRNMILWLIDQARIESWVFEKALEQAEAYLQLVTLKEEGLLYKAIVLRAMGDLPRTYKLFRDLDDDPQLKGSSFQLRGLGMVEAKLGLDKLAEQHLTQACAISKPIDPRNYAALATFYLDRGRAREAVEPARKAVLFKTRRDPTAAEIVGFHEVLVRALLAVGDVQGAAQGAATAVDASLQLEADYQAACVAYAKKEPGTAEPLFQQAYNSGRMPEALLGIAACQLASGKIAEGQDSLRKVVDDQPRLRHLGLAGLGLSLSSGRGEDAIEKIDAALVTFPNHPYLLYLLGRQRRLNGDLEGAVEPLRKALRQHDDFLEALAELTMAYYGLYERNQDAEALISALRYVDRLAELDQAQGGKSDLFLEMQGRIHYDARDFRGAREAFKKGEARSLFCQIGLSMLEYIQKRQDLAVKRLTLMMRDLAGDDPMRKHAEFLLQLMVRHGDKEQVVDRFDRKDLGKAWQGGARGVTGYGIPEGGGELRFQGKFRRGGASEVSAPRGMTGPGRFLTLTAEMKKNTGDQCNFTGVQLTIPGSRGTAPRFSLRVGLDDRDKVVVVLVDGKADGAPIDTGITATRGEWHRIEISVDDADDADPKDPSRYLRVFFDGASLFPKDRSKLNTLRRTDSKSRLFVTEFRAEGDPLTDVDVAFRNYRRVQEMMK